MTIEIHFSNLWTNSPTSDDERAPLTHLTGENNHVHGLLQLSIEGRIVPSLGYFGPDDVCFNAWVAELTEASRLLVASDPASHVYDEGEQAQPAFHFDREGDRVFVSVRRSMVSDAEGDPSWERVPCALDEFVEVVARFLESFRSALITEAGREKARAWLRQVEGARLDASGVNMPGPGDES